MLIDIVIPIYNAYEALSNCLKSLENNQLLANEIYLINDASTNSKINELLNTYVSKNKWIVINHIENMGFVKTANEGLKLSTNHTVLLNSDTIVSKYWLHALHQALEQNNDIGTITTWSNNAEICSFPEFLKNNKAPQNLDRFSKTLYKSHIAKYPILPTAVGFCMLITKQAKLKVGYFDEDQFGHGYGEENDYSLRVVDKGLKNILCDNAFVVHIGNESFNDLGLQPNEFTMKRLLQKHPSYITMIQKYIDCDPLSVIRKEILDMLLLNKKN